VKASDIIAQFNVMRQSSVYSCKW